MAASLCRISRTLFRPLFQGRPACLASRTLSSQAAGTAEGSDDCSSSDSSGSDSSGGEEDTEYQVKLRVLRSSLPYVHEHGWTQNALAAGAEAEGLPGIAHGLFPRGGVELVLYHYNDCNKCLAEQLATKVVDQQSEQETAEKTPFKVQPFIRDAVETRLRMIIPYMDKWPQAMGILALPQNAPDALKNLTNLTDEIWYYAGDRSTDFNWYTKRMSLGAVYKTTEIFMVQDKSEDYIETWQFLDRRMDDIGTIGSLTKACRESGTVVNEASKGLFIMAKNILGSNFRAR